MIPVAPNPKEENWKPTQPTNSHKHIYRNGIDNTGKYQVCECGYKIRQTLAPTNSIDSELDESIEDFEKACCEYYQSRVLPNKFIYDARAKLLAKLLPPTNTGDTE